MGSVETFEVLEPGILTTVQDLGRRGFSRIGVPLSGALDSFSLRVANLLVGNEEGEAGLEAAVMGLTLKALRKVVVAVTGGDLSPTLNGAPMEMWQAHALSGGDLLAFRMVRKGCRAYVAVAGGIAVPEVMGSRSTFLSGRFGGLEGRGLRKGDLLCAGEAPDRPVPADLRFRADWIPAFDKEASVRVIPGPQEGHFTEAGFRTFTATAWQVTAKSDRIGIRLEGPKIERRPDVEESIISESLIPGSIQVPGDGKPLIILSELVTGGYTKIATVISPDLPKVAQLKPGDRIRFEGVSMEAARQTLREQEERLSAFRKLTKQP
jgi:antagonist of KipI